MGTVHNLRAAGPGITLQAAVDAYLAAVKPIKARTTYADYAAVLAELTARYDGPAGPGDLDSADVAEWFTERWSGRSAQRWNVARAALNSAAAWWSRQGWITGPGPFSRIGRRKVPADRDRALSRAQVERLLTDKRIPLRERLLWRLLYESSARASEILSLNVEDLDMPNRRARTTRKGGAIDVVVWQTESARLLPRYLQGRTSGPLFVTERAAKVELPAADLDERGRARLAYDTAERLFKDASGGATLHQLRHSRLSHAAEDGESTPQLMARSGHTSVRSLAKYARISPEAYQAHMEATDPARRGR